MNIAKKLNGSELLYELEGSIDSTTAPQLDKEINESLKGIESLILDFTKVDYISSGGLRVLLVAFRAMAKQGKMVIRHPNKQKVSHAGTPQIKENGCACQGRAYSCRIADRIVRHLEGARAARQLSQDSRRYAIIT